MKALLDALKVMTTGRRDGILLHNFEAVGHDAAKFVKVSCSCRKPLERQKRPLSIRCPLYSVHVSQRVTRQALRLQPAIHYNLACSIRTNSLPPVLVNNQHTVTNPISCTAEPVRQVPPLPRIDGLHK